MIGDQLTDVVVEECGGVGKDSGEVRTCLFGKEWTEDKISENT